MHVIRANVKTQTFISSRVDRRRQEQDVVSLQHKKGSPLEGQVHTKGKSTRRASPPAGQVHSRIEMTHKDVYCKELRGRLAGYVFIRKTFRACEGRGGARREWLFSLPLEPSCSSEGKRERVGRKRKISLLSHLFAVSARAFGEMPAPRKQITGKGMRTAK